MVFVKKKTTVPVSALYMFAVWCLISMTAHADTCLECHSEWEDNDRAPSKLISTNLKKYHYSVPVVTAIRHT